MRHNHRLAASKHNPHDFRRGTLAGFLAELAVQAERDGR
jgi:hypothetical protein